MLEIIKHMGFDDKWLGWIKCIFGSGTSSVLLNGVPGHQFVCKCGPLSPLIFVLAVDLLQSAINDAYRKSLIEQSLPARENTEYPVVQYADDTILLMPACPNQAETMKKILLDYADSIGLKINFHKSVLIPLIVTDVRVTQLAKI